MSDEAGTIIPFPSIPAEEVNPNLGAPAAPTIYDEFFHHMTNLSQKGLAICRKKNVDYAGTGDPFDNFNIVESIGVSAPRGMLVRMLDKISRISNLLQRDPAVTNESLEDTCIDLAMYALILATYLRMYAKAADE